MVAPMGTACSTTSPRSCVSGFAARVKVKTQPAFASGPSTALPPVRRTKDVYVLWRIRHACGDFRHLPQWLTPLEVLVIGH